MYVTNTITAHSFLRGIVSWFLCPLSSRLQRSFWLIVQIVDQDIPWSGENIWTHSSHERHECGNSCCTVRVFNLPLESVPNRVWRNRNHHWQTYCFHARNRVSNDHGGCRLPNHCELCFCRAQMGLTDQLTRTDYPTPHLPYLHWIVLSTH